MVEIPTDTADERTRPTPLKRSPSLTEAVTGGVVGRVLIAEDSEINQMLVGEILRSEGFQCTSVFNGRMALEAMRTEPYDVVLMDCEMPEMDGFAATRAFRELEESGRLGAAGHRHLPIIALTAHVDMVHRQKCLAAGMDGFLSKPIDGARLVVMIQHWSAVAKWNVVARLT